MSRFVSRSVACLFATLVLLTQLVTPARAASITTANPFPSPFAVAPVVTLSGAPNVVVITLGNTAAVPSPVTVQFTGWCWDANSKRIDFANKPFTTVVPPDLSETKGAIVLKRLSQALVTPKACVHQPPLPNLRLPDGNYFVTLAVPGQKPWGAMSAPFFIGKPFILANIRYNLDLKVGKTPPYSQAHHTLPQAYRATFVKGGLNIDDPQHLVWWCSKPGVKTNHQSNAKRYNALWTPWMTAHPVPTTSAGKERWRADALKYRDSIFGGFTYNCP